jgi:flavin-dependent dehydrogenase
MDLIDDLGAGDAVRSGPHALVREGVAVFPDGTRIGRRYERPGYIVPRLALDDALKQALTVAGATVIEGRRVTKILLENDRACGVRGDGFEWRAPRIVAADGYGSIGLAPLGREKPRDRLLALSATAYFRGVRFPHGTAVADHYFEHDLPCGYGWIFPEVEGSVNAGVYLRQDAYRSQGTALARLLDDFVARHPERFDAAERLSENRVWLLPIAPAPRPAAGRGILLVGDAGGFVDPFTGEGIWQALHTGTLAGTLLVEAAESGFTPELCRRFEADCDARIRVPSRKKLRVQDGMRTLLRARLYRLPPVRTALRYAYRRRSLEMTKV